LEAKDFTALRISLASPEDVRGWSYGEVTKPETINYRRLRPEKDGLFCEAIFGPTKDYQCYCGKYKNIRYKGVTCDKCGVEVTRASVRRERMGHIELAAPVAHVWYTRRVPSYLGLLLDVSRRNLDRVLYFAQYVVTSVDDEARQKASKRIERELHEKEHAITNEIEGRRMIVQEEREAVFGRLDDRIAGIDAEIKNEIAKRSDEIVQEARSLHQRIEKLIGQRADEDIVFGDYDEVIIESGETTSIGHLSSVQELVNALLNELQSDMEEERQQAIAQLKLDYENFRGDMSVGLDEHVTDLQNRIQTIRDTARRTRDDLEKIHRGQFLSETQYREMKNRFGNVFEANMGAEAFHQILSTLDLESLAEELWIEVRTTRSKQRKKKATKRLSVVEALRKSNNRPEWMIMTVLPVIPPDLRPMVQLDGGRFATSDLNDLYRRVINRNNRLKHLLDLAAPDVIVRNEKRMLQEAVDSLIDNSQRGKALSRRGRRELKSLSDMLKGKKGRFRRNLLGKRVDYSGRSVIVIGPKLKLYQCGLPKTMALELYRPFVISRLDRKGYVNNVKGAKRLIEREKPEVWEVLEEVIKERPVLLNRAPTLHRLGIQAFEPILVEGKAIQIHPLVCSAFNADFDGDQMAVHVPLSDKAVAEARELMLSTRNLLKPSDGKPIVGPSKDMCLGCYYLTMDPSVEIITRPERADEFRTIHALKDATKKIGIAMYTNGYYYNMNYEIANVVYFEDIVVEDENGRQKVVESAIDRTLKAVISGEVDATLANAVEVRKLLKKRGLSDQLTLSNLYERRLVTDMDEVEYLYGLGIVGLHTPILLGNYYDENPPQDQPEPTTIGRAIFNRILPDEMRFVQETLGKKGLTNLVGDCYTKIGADRTTDVVDAIKNYGFHYATISGTTIAISDLTIPEERGAILERTEKAVERAEKDFRRGLLTEDERYQITVDQWTNAKDTLQELIRSTMDPYGPVAVMALSGSTKGGFGPITQLAGMRGLMADPSGRIIDLPIRSHFREGLTALEYFISTHGARKGLADTALRTADAGYLTRRLVDVAQDCIINRTDCGTQNAQLIRRNQDIAGQDLSERIIGRCVARDVIDPETGEVIIRRNELIVEDIAEALEKNKAIAEVPVRSPMTCALIHGICALCYGRDLGRGEMVTIGTAVGIIAAQSIGEPGTQLTLRTFHTGGTANASGDITSGLPRVEELFEGRKKPKGESIISDIGGVVRLTKRDGIRIATVTDSEVFNDEYVIPGDWNIVVEDDVDVKENDILAESPDGAEVTLARMAGRTYIEFNNQNGYSIFIRYEKRNEMEYELPSNSRLLTDIFDGAVISPGQQLTEGSKNPHRILRILGEEAAQLYLLTEVQKVYRSQGVNIADKHFEIMIRKMLSKVQITRSGNTKLLPGELIDKLQLLHINTQTMEQGGEPAAGAPILLGVTKAALNTDSFLSASSFQHTIRVLAGAAIEGKEDKLFGLKENVIIGKLIPAGTGFHTYQDRELVAPNTSLEAMGALDYVIQDDDDDGLMASGD